MEAILSMYFVEAQTPKWPFKLKATQSTEFVDIRNVVEATF